MGTESTMQLLGRRLAACRTQAGLDVASLGARAVVPPNVIAGFENGQGGLGAGALARIAAVLGVPVASLMNEAAPEVAAPLALSAKLFTTSIASLQPSDLDFLTHALQRARAFAELGDLLGVEPPDVLLSPGPAPTAKAYREGYETARAVRQALPEVRERPIRELTRLIEDRFDILVARHPFANPEVLGAACRVGDARLIVVNATVEHVAAQRLILAHELCHHLKDLAGDGARVDEEEDRFSMEPSPEEQRAKAFGPLLLAPEDALARFLDNQRPLGHEPAEARELVRRARHAFGLGFDAMAWHLHNVGYLRYRETVQVLLQSSDTDEVQGFETEARLDGLARRAKEALEALLISEGRYRELLQLPFDAPAPS